MGVNVPDWLKGKSKSKSKTYCPRKEDSEYEDGTPRHRSANKKEKASIFDGVVAPRKSSDPSPRHVVCESKEFVFGHPLPLPTSISSPLLAYVVREQGAVPTSAFASASVSVSSDSSSGSSDDAHDQGFSRFADPINTLRGRKLVADGPYSPAFEHQKHSESSVSPSKGFQLQVDAHANAGAMCCHGQSHMEGRFSKRNTSPSPGSRVSPCSTSPVHPRTIGLSPISPNQRMDNLRSVALPLPLPPSPPSSSSSSSLRSPKLQWKKGKLLGRGTFGHVYTGFNSESGQMCAIKEVKDIADDKNSKECLRQLNQEILLLSQLSHPNIVQYYDSELAEDTLSIYLEYVSGGSIHKLLQEYGPFSEPLVRSYTAQILSGLAYLHGRNTVHRDIKGANILVDPNGEIKLADFGMAKHISSYISVHSFKGSPYWMAPEVVMNANGYNLSVDIWSLGCTVIEMATARPPWSQFEGIAAIFKIGNSRELPEIPDHFSSEGKDFLRLCLQRDPSARPLAAKLMDHPFVRDQPTIKAAKYNLAKDVQSSTYDGGLKMGSTEFTSNRSFLPRYDVHHVVKQGPAFSAFPSKYHNTSDIAIARMNMSLPVSPCSSPKKQFKQSHRSCLPSPPHPSFSPRAANYSPVNYILSPTRPGNNLDPWFDISHANA